jgi:DNA-binding CsgD family transcriptional regulator
MSDIYVVMTNVPPIEWHGVVGARRQVIGRGPEADIEVWPKYSTVSRRHAEIWGDKQGVRLRDLGSKGGTCVNGVWLEAGREVNAAVCDRIWLAALELQLVDRLSHPEEPKAGLDDFSVPDDDPTDAWNTPPIGMRALLAALTPAEVDVVLWICRGCFDDRELGRMLHRSPNTIRTHVSNILRKLNLSSRQELVSWLRLRQP